MAQVIVDFSCQPGRVRKSWETHLKEGLSVLEGLCRDYLDLNWRGKACHSYCGWATPGQGLSKRTKSGKDAGHQQHVLTTLFILWLQMSSPDALSSCCLDFPNMTHCALNWELTNPFCLKFLCSEYLPQQQERHQYVTGIRTWILISTPIGKLVWKCVSITSALGL